MKYEDRLRRKIKNTQLSKEEEIIRRRETVLKILQQRNIFNIPVLLKDVKINEIFKNFGKTLDEYIENNQKFSVIEVYEMILNFYETLIFNNFNQVSKIISEFIESNMNSEISKGGDKKDDFCDDKVTNND